MKFTRQFDTMDCGPACVRMMASFYGREYPLIYLRSLCHLSKEGVTVAGIRHALEEIGFQSISVEMTESELACDCPLPAILYWEQKHFVVLEKISRRGKFIIYDPAFGRNEISKKDFEKSWINGTKGIVIAAEPTKTFFTRSGVVVSHSFLDFGKKYILPYKLQIIQSALAMLIGTLIALILPFLTQAIVDQGITTHNIGLIYDILLAQLTLFIGQFVMNLVGSWVTLYLSVHVSIHILGDYLSKLLKLPMYFFDTKSTGDFQQRLGDHNRLRAFMTGSTVETAFALFTIPVYLIVIGTYSVKILLIFLFFTILSTVWISYFFRKRKALDYEQFAVNSRNQTKLYEMMEGITDIKINHYDVYKLQEWEDLQLRQYDMSCKSLKLAQSQETGMTVIGQLRNLLITCLIAVEVVKGNLSLGMMMSIGAIIGMISEPLGKLTRFLQQYQDAKISLERSMEVQLTDQEDLPNQLPIPYDNAKDIELHNVSFSYTHDLEKPILEKININIPAGKMTAIVGESGSGKTTLMKLLLKFYEPDTGEILLGGVSLKKYTAASLRERSGIVMQDNFLFSDTLSQNIILGELLDPQRLDIALKAACLEEFVKRHPLGAEMRVGSEGIGVSGGEKQRIMIARAIYKKPLYLMMDEATSSLDAENETKITSNIAECFQGKTRIVIAHRLSTVKDADNIVVLKRGRVVEQGTHSQLVSLRGYYYSLIQNQLEISSQ